MGTINSDTTERARLFRMVRDIPYYIALGDEQDYCCLTKPFLLDRLLSTVSVASRHILCTFKWSDLPLPKALQALPHDDDDTHEFLEVYSDDIAQWTRVDPNWDSGVAKLGLPIGDWQGDEANTPIAVRPLKIYTADESAAMIREEDDISQVGREAYLVRNGEFFGAVNRWLAEARLSD